MVSRSANCKSSVYNFYNVQQRFVCISRISQANELLLMDRRPLSSVNRQSVNIPHPKSSRKNRIRGLSNSVDSSIVASEIMVPRGSI